MPRAVGLDVGSRLLKLAELSGSPKSFKVQRFLVEELPTGEGEDGDAARAETIRRIFAENKLGKDDVCVSFDAGTTVFRDVTVPFRQDDQIERVVRFEAENHLHGRAIEDVVVNWVRTGETKEGSQIIVMAAPKAELAERLALLRRADIEPASVDLDATALYTACEATGVFGESPNVVILEIGARTTNLLLVDGGRLRTVRAFVVGADAVTAAVAQDLALPPGDAARHVQAPGETDTGALLVPAVHVSSPSREARETSKSVAELERDVTTGRRDDFVRKLEREVMRSITSSRAVNAPEKILVSGGGSLMPGLREALAERFGLPVEPLGLLTRVGYAAVPAVGADPLLAEAVSPVAIGCALRLLGADPLGVELRREEFAPTNTFEVVKIVLATAVTLLVALLGGLAYLARDRFERERTLFAVVQTRARSILLNVEKRYQQDIGGKMDDAADKEAKRVADAIPNDADYLLSVRTRLSRRYRELEDNLGLSKDIPAIKSALLAWVEIYKALESVPRDDHGWFRVNKMSVSQQSASLTIEIQDEPVKDKVVAALTKSPYIQERAKEPAHPVSSSGLQRNATTARSTVTLEIQFVDDSR
jgi:type IV pilus assembly protein PilM